MIFNKKYDFTLTANYLFVVYAFFISISMDITRDIFTLILILFFLSGNIKDKLLFAIKDKVVQAFLAFYIIHFIWMIGSQSIEVAQYKVSSLRYMLYIIIYITMIRSDFVYKILNGFLFGIFFNEIISYLMFIGIKIPFLPYQTTGFANVPFALSYTQYSILLSISMGVMLYLILTYRQNIYMNILYGFFFVSSSTNIFIIESKLGYGLYFISIVTVLIFFVIRNKKYNMILFTLSLAFFGYLFAYNFSSVFQVRVNGFVLDAKSALISDNYSTSTGARVGFYHYGFEIFKNNTLFGVGTGDHINEFIKFIKEKEDDQNNFAGMTGALDLSGSGNLHSEYLDASLQFGILGLLLFLNIFYQIMVYDTKNDNIKVINILLPTILLVVSTVSLVFGYSMLGKMFTLLTALTLNKYSDIDVNKVKYDNE